MAPEEEGSPMNSMSKLQKRIAMPLLFLFVVALLFCALGSPAHAGDVAGVSTHLFLTVTGDVDGDAEFYVSYTDALGPHTKVYYPGIEIAAWTPVTITVVNHTADHWTLDVDVQETWLQGVGGVTTHGDVFRVTGTNSVQVFATNFGLHYVNVHVALSELDDGGSGGNTGNDDGNGGSGGSGGGTDTGNTGGDGGDGGSGGNGGGTDPSNPGGNGGNGGSGGGTDPSNPGGDGGNGGSGGDTNPDDTNGNGDDGDTDSNVPDRDTGDNGNDSDKDNSSSPKTGDTRMIGILVLLALLCAVVFAVTYIRRRKKTN